MHQCASLFYENETNFDISDTYAVWYRHLFLCTIHVLFFYLTYVYFLRYVYCYSLEGQWHYISLSIIFYFCYPSRVHMELRSEKSYIHYGKNITLA